MGQLSAEEVAAFQADRAELAGDAPMVSVPPEAAVSAFAAYLTQLEASLEAPYLFGSAPSIADFSVFHCLWFIQQNPVNAECIAPFPNIVSWMVRIAGFGHGEVAEATAEESLAHARETEPVVPALSGAALPGVVIGDPVLVTPTDYGKVPVAGTLVAASDMEIVIEREAPEVARVMTHFPNIGFQVAGQ
jgi:hypothetical protein